MNRLCRAAFVAAVLAVVPLYGFAQPVNAQELPPLPQDNPPPPAPPGIYSTHPQAAPILPWQHPQNTPNAPSTYHPANPLPGQMPFGRPSSDTSQFAPSGSPATQAVPVPGVEAGEMNEPAAAAPTALPPGANPAEENPATPTETTSPIFANEAGGPSPKKIIFRALNKVTGRSELFEARPGQTVNFDKLEINAVTCQASIPSSQLDYAGLFELHEHVPAQVQTKLLFRGWMYASSPSITSLEHPIYDVTMVKCEMPEPPPVAKKPSKKSAKP